MQAPHSGLRPLARNRRSLVWANAKEFDCFDYNEATASVNRGVYKGTCHPPGKSWQCWCVRLRLASLCIRTERILGKAGNSSEGNGSKASERHGSLLLNRSWSLSSDASLPPSDSVRMCTHARVCRKAWGGSQCYNYRSVQRGTACFPSVQQRMWAC